MSIRNLNRAFLGIALLAILLCSLGCVHQTKTDQYSYFQSLPKVGWLPSHTLRYHVFLSEEGAIYQTRLSVRWNNELDRLNSKAIFTLLGRGREFYRDTVNLTFAERPGVWIPKGISTRELVVPLKKPITAPLMGIFQVEMKLLSTDTLRGIVSVGVELEREYRGDNIEATNEI